MTALRAVLAAVALAAAGCFGGEAEPDVAERFHELAAAGDTVTYQAAYRFQMLGPLSEAVQTRLRIVQDPPASLRLAETTTATPDGDSVTIPQWIVQLERGNYACARYSEDVACVETAAPTSLFGLAVVDEIFRLARTPGSFASVEETEPIRVNGIRATCFKAATGTPDPTTPDPSPTPRFVPDRFVYEYCFSAEGILLRARRVIAGRVPADQQERREMVLEVTAVDTDVAPEDIQLPGEVKDPSDLRS